MPWHLKELLALKFAVCQQIERPKACERAADRHVAWGPWQPISLADFKTPGAELKGIYYLRNVVDADRIIAALPEAKERGGRVCCKSHCAVPVFCLLACRRVTD